MDVGSEKGEGVTESVLVWDLNIWLYGLLDERLVEKQVSVKRWKVGGK